MLALVADCSRTVVGGVWVAEQGDHRHIEEGDCQNSIEQNKLAGGDFLEKFLKLLFVLLDLGVGLVDYGQDYRDDVDQSEDEYKNHEWCQQ